jgi:hypothetical protein
MALVPRISTSLVLLLIAAAGISTPAWSAAVDAPIETISPKTAGFYRVARASVTVPDTARKAVELRVSVARNGVPAAPPVFQTILEPGTEDEFDPFLGFLDAGDDVTCASTGVSNLRWELERLPAIPVAAIEAADLVIPHSGFYALSDASVQFDGMPAGPARFQVTRGGNLLRDVEVSGGTARLNHELGYLRQGERIRLAVATSPGERPIGATFGGTLVEWAPRRAPLRVQRGPDGLLDVIEPGTPLSPVDIPAERWVRVAAMTGDATEAIRQALREAGTMAKSGGYAGVRLDSEAAYLVGSSQASGAIFSLDGLNRVVLDGNGATFDVRATDLDRRGVELFVANSVRSVVLSHFRTRSMVSNSTYGAIVEVSPPQDGNQTVTFRLAERQESPLALIPSGNTSGYAYDDQVPGKLATGTWSHYPPPPGGKPNLEATSDPRVFRHTVTRTNGSIPVGAARGEPAKWLVKQKKAGVLLLTVRAAAEDITLCDVVSGGATNGVLRIWGGSGVNVLNCRIEPPAGQWISTSSDGFHGRAREAVWLENVVIAGVCEDVLNLYSTPLALTAATGTKVDLVELSRNEAAPGGFRVSPLPPGTVRPGDWLAFCAPASGEVLGRVRVLMAESGDRFILSAPVPKLHPWDPAQGRSNVMVYNESAAAGLVMRDCEIRDSLRFGVFLKARDCLILHNRFTGLTGAAIQGANEPEWPEGPFPQNLWLQDNRFAGNAHGYEPRHRAFLCVDPAAVAIYARKLGGPAGTGVFAANDIRILDNQFAEWRGVAVAVRNARSVQLQGNTFSPPLDDSVVRQTLALDPLFTQERHGRCAAILLQNCRGVRVQGNHFPDLPPGDLPLAIGPDVSGLDQDP